MEGPLVLQERQVVRERLVHQAVLPVPQERRARLEDTAAGDTEVATEVVTDNNRTVVAMASRDPMVADTVSRRTVVATANNSPLESLVVWELPAARRSVLAPVSSVAR